MKIFSHLKAGVLTRFFFLSFFFWLAYANASADSIFRVRLVEDAGTLDWNYGEVNPEVIYQIMEGLFKVDSTGRSHAQLVKSYKTSDNGRTVSITLKNGLRWSDGSPLCAEDFVRSWKRLQSKKFASPYAHYANVLKTYSAKGCTELSLGLTRSTPELPSLLAHYVFFPVHAGEGNVWDFVNGPFKIESWRKDQKIILERNSNYHSRASKLEEIEFLFIPEDATAVALFKEKKIDWMKSIPVVMRKGLDIKKYPALVAFYLGLNESKSGLLKDPKIRKALSWSLHREDLPKILGEEVKGITSWFLPEFSMLTGTYSTNAKLLFSIQHPEIKIARGLLEEAVKQGKMDLRLRVYNKPAHKLLAEWLQAQWQKELGVTIPIDVFEEKNYWKEIAKNPSSIFISGVTAPYAHPRAFFQEFLSSSTANWTSWRSPKYDAFVESGNYLAANELLEKDSFIIPIYQRGVAALVNPNWKNFFINPLGQVHLSELHF